MMPPTKHLGDKITKRSKLISSGLFILFLSLVYSLFIFEKPLWPYGYLHQSLLLSLLIILALRLFPPLSNPGIKSSFFIFFWSSFLALALNLMTMDGRIIVTFLADIQSYFGLEALFFCALIYLILLSIPFVPGVEIGLLIMAAFGKFGVIAVYLATIGGLSLAYYFGHSFPHLWKIPGLRHLKLFTTSKFSENGTANLPGALQFVLPFIPWILRFRYLTIALLINLPGNAIFGGGGGIAFLSGASRKLNWARFMITLCIATLPVPLLIYFGFMEIEKLLP